MMFPVLKRRLEEAFFDACAPLLTETPPRWIGAGRGHIVRKVRMREGHRMLVDIRVPEQRDAWRTGVYEDNVLSLTRRTVPEGGVFIDVGANVGFYACGVGSDLSRRGGTVYAFEPVSSNRRWLLRNIRMNGLQNVVTVLPFALGDQPGSMVMRRVPAGKASNAVGQNMFSEWDRMSVDRNGWASEEVPVTRVDDWSSCLDRCDVMKIDVEGADLLVLRGAVETIGRFRPVVFAEFNPYWMKQICQSLDDVRRFARRHDYDIRRLFGDRFLPVGEQHADRDNDVPSYLLFPRERASEVSKLLS